MGKIRVQHGNHVVELEGDDSFIEKQLASFYAKIGAESLNAAASDTPNSRAKRGSAKKKPGKRSSGEESSSSTSKKSGRKTKTKNIAPERFDIHKTKDAPSLEEFYAQKAPGEASGNRIAVIAYYITQIKGGESFTEGQIEYAYRQLKLHGRPAHLRQVIINNKNKHDLFDSDEDGVRWLLTRAGEIFVDEKLPLTAKEKSK